MSNAPMHPSKFGQARPSTPKIDKSVIVPILACSYSSIIFPLIYLISPATKQSMLDTRPENRFFWPALFVISVILAVRNRSRLGRLTLPPHIICFLAYLSFAGASTLWAFNPGLSIVRFAQEVMVVVSIFLPAMLAARTTDMMRGLFICFTCASILNLLFIIGGAPQTMADGVAIGYPGYFTGKNLLGEFSAISLLLALHEMLYPGLRRMLGLIGVVITTSLLFLANSKTALGLTLLVPILAKFTLIISKRTRISPAIILLSAPIFYLILSNVSGFNMNRVSFFIYGDSSFTGRQTIWNFAQYEIARRPIFGWGYQSFWLVGGDAPSVTEAPGWVKTMPNAHNGYYDTMLEMGYVGYALLVTFIVATLHAIGRMADRVPARAWLMLSLALYIIIHNGLESTWMRAFDFMWVVFAIVAAEVGRHWQPAQMAMAAYRSRPLIPNTPAPPRGAHQPIQRSPVNPSPSSVRR